MEKKASIVICITAILLTFAACASGTKRGSVVMKISENEAHVGMGQNDVNVGDHIELYRNVCTGSSRGKDGGGGERACKKEPAGHGEVTQVLNEDYSVVKFPDGTRFGEGDTLEKHGH